MATVSIKPAGSVAGMPVTETASLTTANTTAANNNKDYINYSIFENADPNPELDFTYIPESSFASNLTATIEESTKFENYLGQLLSGPDLEGEARGLLFSATSQFGNTTGLQQALGDALFGTLGKVPLNGGTGSVLTGNGNFVDTVNVITSTLNEAKNSIKLGLFGRTLNKADFKLPGMPGVFTDKTPELKQSLVNAASNLAGNVNAGIASSLNQFENFSPEAIANQAKSNVDKITKIAATINTKSLAGKASLAEVVKKVVTFTALGGDRFLPGSQAAFSAITKAGQKLDAATRAALERSAGQIVQSPLTALNDKTPKIDLTGASREVTAALNATVPETTNLVSSLPADYGTASNLSPEAATLLKEQFAVTALSAGGAIKNAIPGAIATDTRLLLLQAKGLSINSITSLTSRVV